MRARKQWAFFLIVICLAVPAWTQKASTKFEKGFPFGEWKRYAWGEKKLYSRQRPEDQKRLDSAIVKAVDRQLKARGFTYDAANPDFVVSYIAGSGIEGQEAYGADISRPNGPTWTYSSDNLSNPTGGLWVWIDGRIKFTVTDGRSNRVVWESLVTKKYQSAKEVMRNLDRETEKVAKKAFGKFPPK